MATIDLWKRFARAPTDQSFEPLYEATKRLVWTLSLRLLRDPAEASDAFQGAYAKLVALAREPDAARSIDDLEAFVARIAVREADRLRKRRSRRREREKLVVEERAMEGARRPPGSRLEERWSPLAESEETEVRERVGRIVEDLPEAYRVPIVLHYFDGLSLREIARALELPLGTVVSRHRRALEKLEGPLRRAGLADGAQVLSAVAMGAALLEPRFRATTIFAAASAKAVPVALASSLAASSAASRTFGALILMGTLATKTKTGIVALVLAVLLAGGWTLWTVIEDHDSSTLARRPGAALESGRDSGVAGTDGGERSPAEGARSLPESESRPREALSVAVYWRHSKQAVVRAEVSIRPAGGEAAEIARGTTDDQGRATLALDLDPALDPDRVRVEVIHPESEIGVVDATLPAGDTISLALVRDVITGVVTDASTGAPIPGAVVRIADFGKASVETTADSDGVYVLARPEAGNLRLVASAPGRADESARVEHPEPGISLQDFSLDPGATLRVRVTGEDGAPIPGARVTPSLDGMEGVFYTDLGVDTGVAGEARIERVSRAQPPNVQIAKEGYDTVYARPRIDPALDFAELLITLSEVVTSTRVIVGRVTSEDGRAIAGARIEWKDGAGTRFSDDEPYGEIFALTDQRGAYRLEFIDDYETCHLGVGAAGHAPHIERRVRPGTPDRPLELDFVLGDGHWLEGTVVDEAGEAIPGVEIDAMPSASLLHESVAYPVVRRMATTDAEGRFRLDDLSGPGAALALRSSGRPRREEEVEVDRDLEIVLPGYGEIRGRVVDAATGAAIESFTVRIRSAPHGVSVDQAQIGTSFTSPEGRFALANLDPSGPHTLEILAPGYPSATFEGIEPTASVPNAERTFTLERGRELEGLVIDAETGAPLGGVRVQASASQHAESIVPRDWDPYRQTLGVEDFVTAADGRFHFVESPPLWLLIHTRGRQRVFLRPSERSKLEDASGIIVVPLERAETLAGVVVENGVPLAGVDVSLDRILAAKPDAPNPRPAERHGQVTSDLQGRFAWDDLAPGEYRVVLTHRPGEPSEGFEVETRRYVTVAKGEAATLEIERSAGGIMLEGAVAGMDGKESVWVEISLRREAVAETPEVFFKTYAEWSWRYTCPGLAPGTYRGTATYYTKEGNRTAELPAFEIDARSSNPHIRVPPLEGAGERDP